MPFDIDWRGIPWPGIALGLWAGVGVLAAAHALISKRDHRSAWGWIAVCWLFPLAGPFLYYLFGINRVKIAARELGVPAFRDAAPAAPVSIPPALENVAHTASALTQLPLLPGNRIDMLVDGEQAFPRMLDAIDGARQSVAILTYIWEHDALGRRFIAAVERAVRRGVAVHVIIDGFGELQKGWRVHRQLRRAGAEVALFLPPRLLPPALHFNLRNHRKLMLIDGERAFAGGMNLSGRHCIADPDNRHPIADTHFELRGPIVAQLAQAFARDWRFCARREWTPPDGRPPACGEAACRVVEDGPNEADDRLEWLLQAGLHQAQASVRIMTPYFLPSRELVAALRGAALRGVSVEIYLPASSNLSYVHWATRRVLAELLRYGVRVYYQPPPFCHSKLFLLDGHYALIGSTNIDPRSLELNFEIGVEVYDAGFAGRLGAHFDAARRRSERLPADALSGSSLAARLRDSFFWLFSSYL